MSGVYSQFVFGLAYINEVILRDSKGTGSSAFGIAGSGLNTREYDQQDANWNTTSLYETAGVSSGIIERFIYDPYGTPKTLTNAWASFTDTSIYWRFLYQGTYWLTEANVYIMGARDFDYTIGTWDQKDVPYIDGMNLCQGFDGNPVNRVDASGRDAAPTTQQADEIGWSNWGNASKPESRSFTRNGDVIVNVIPPTTHGQNWVNPVVKEEATTKTVSVNQAIEGTSYGAPGQVGKPDEYKEEAGYEYQYRQAVTKKAVSSDGPIRVTETVQNV